jgi:luciferase-type oxidoreductase
LETAHYGTLKGQIDVLRKAKGHKIPLMITGGSRQSLEWNAENGDGWMSYARDFYNQYNTIRQWRQLVAKNHNFDKPFMQPLYVILDKDDNLKPHPIQLGFKVGANYLVDYLQKAQDIGVNHVALNLRFNSRDIQETLEQLAQKVLPDFHSNKELKVTT